MKPDGGRAGIKSQMAEGVAWVSYPPVYSCIAFGRG